MRPGITVAPATSMTRVFGTHVARDFLARAARHDAAVVDRQRLDDAEARVDREDLAVRDDRVGVALCARDGAERGKNGKSADRDDEVLQRSHGSVDHIRCGCA